MIFRRLANPLIRYSFSGGHHHTAPAKLQRVDDKIVWLNVKNIYGEYERVPAFEGQSLTSALVRSSVSGVQARCCGRGAQVPLHQRPGDPYSYGPGCKSCTVIIRNPWKQKIEKQLGPTEFIQKSAIYQSDILDADMRVACYIPITPWMKQMNVIVSQNVDNDNL